MARIFTDGAEMYDGLLFSGTAPSLSNAVYASGSYAYYVTAGGPTSAYITVSTFAEVYFRARVRYTDYAAGNVFVALRNGATTLVAVKQSAIAQWLLYSGAVLVDTSSKTMLKNTWYCLELYYKCDAVNGELTLRIDGNEVCTFSGDTQVAAETGFDNLYLSCALGSLYWDDLALNDSTGGSDDSWCGGGRIVALTPNGNGTTNDWDGSDGNKIDNYLLVDEYPSDGDTTYVYSDASVPGTLDQYAMTAYTDTDRTIERIWAEARGRKTSADPATLKIGFDTGASVNTDDAGVLYETYSVRLVSDEYTTNPDDAAAWEKADLDALQFVTETG